ncbi:MAG TPA: DUF1801 domain-containing protein [Burkholderiales bacterium]|jgi:hypothetical protein
MQSVEKLIQGLPYEQQATLYKLREIVLKAEPAIVETVKWNTPVYSRGKNLVSLVPQKTCCLIQLWDGASLAERYPALLQDPKTDVTGMRHLKVSYRGRPNYKMITEVLTEALRAAQTKGNA